MKTTTGMTLNLSRHACKTAAAKGFTAEAISDCFEHPTEVYPSGSHPGQFRIVNGDVCLVGVPDGNVFRCITLYRDRVLTAPRADQMNTPEGRRYAERYAKGQGRG
jgi:hypothetical protein